MDNKPPEPGPRLESSPFRALRFSTEDFPADKQLEAYRDIFGSTIVPHDIEPMGEGPFHFEADLCRLPGLGLSTASISPSRRWHGPQHITSDDLILGIGLSGGCVVRQRGREAVIEPGQAVLTSSADPADILIPTASRPVSLRLPLAALRARIGNLDNHIATRVPKDADGLVLLTGYVNSLCRADLTNPKLRTLAVGHVYDLVTMIFSEAGEARSLAERGGVSVARRAAILREIANRSSNPGLTAVTVAILLGITPRYLHLLLEETGMSFTHHLLERRLQHSVKLLQNSDRRQQRISDIAFEAGFTDLSYFNRAFRRRYGATPSDIRYAANNQDQSG